MTKSNKVVWYEGMNLDPHHFQQWDRFHKDNLNFQLQALSNNNWGFTKVEIDKDALKNGQFKLQHCNGILPDGFAFQMPDRDSLPLSRTITDSFPATQEKLGVYLTIPVESAGGLNCLLDDSKGSRKSRFKLSMKNVADENIGANEREIGVARSNFRISFENESFEDLSVLKIADIERIGEGEFTINNEFIHPCLTLKASENLQSIIRNILEFLVTKSSALRNIRRQSANGNLEITSRDLTLYFLLSSVNSYIPYLNQCQSSGANRPEEIYKILQSLAGQLAALSVREELQPVNYQVYNHADPADGFHFMVKTIKQLLGDVTPSKDYSVIKLEKKGDTIFLAQIPDITLIRESQLFLVCKGDLPEAKFTRDLPVKLRVASPDMIKSVLKTATTALQVVYTARPPAAAPVKQDSHFIKLKKEGPFWDDILKSKAIVFYIPTEFSSLQSELLLIKDKN